MALFGSRIAQKKQSVTFHYEPDSRKAGRTRRRGKQRRQRGGALGLARTVFSAGALILGFGLCYIALHYVPAQVSPSAVIRMTELDEATLRENPQNPVARIVGPYWSALQSRKSFIRAGESVEVQYRLADGQSAQLIVQRCARQFVKELFDCQVVSEQSVRANKTSGRERLYFQEAGFYHFEERYSGPKPRVVWRRI